MAVYDFGIDPDKAWRLTISDFNVLMKRVNDNERRKNYRAAMIVSTILNVNRDPKKRKKPFTPEEVLGEREHSKEQTPDGLLLKAKLITGQLGGKVNK